MGLGGGKEGPSGGEGLFFSTSDPVEVYHGLPVIVAPVRSVTREWRYVAVSGRVVAGSAYGADGRRPLPDDPGGEPWSFASRIAARLEAPEEIYVLDVCEADGGLHLLELNPFSGADLHACDRAAIVEAISGVVRGARFRRYGDRGDPEAR